MWPAPNGSQPQPRADVRLGAPLDPWPGLQIKGRPLSAATIRVGPGYLEARRGRGRGLGGAGAGRRPGAALDACAPPRAACTP
jgi:hypothetical protein